MKTKRDWIEGYKQQIALLKKQMGYRTRAMEDIAREIQAIENIVAEMERIVENENAD